jgi:hypothetical protein
MAQRRWSRCRSKRLIGLFYIATVALDVPIQSRCSSYAEAQPRMPVDDFEKEPLETADRRRLGRVVLERQGELKHEPSSNLQLH